MSHRRKVQGTHHSIRWMGDISYVWQWRRIRVYACPCRSITDKVRLFIWFPNYTIDWQILVSKVDIIDPHLCYLHEGTETAAAQCNKVPTRSPLKHTWYTQRQKIHYDDVLNIMMTMYTLWWRCAQYNDDVHIIMMMCNLKLCKMLRH